MINVRDLAMQDAKQQVRKSSDWFMKKVRIPMTGMSVQKFLGDNIPHQAKTFEPGQMIHFFYDPKGKEKLPFYDTFPLLLPFPLSPKQEKQSKVSNRTHFIGLNLHYIHPRMRMLVLSRLSSVVDDDTLSAEAKMKFSWQMLSGMSLMPQAKACVKLYLKSHVKSNFIIIPPSEWEYAIWLPSERFKNASAEDVWSNP